MILGLDTSCYTTSCALYDGKEARESRRLLRVPQGEKGLRQSDALFQHTVALPKVLEELGGLPAALDGIAVSSRPREAEGSYMPVFLGGVSLARSLAAVLGVDVYNVSHQQGHIAAALLSAGRLDLAEESFLAWHVSGGTTELLLVKPRLNAARVGGTSDICAGQIIDRAGAVLGLGFPAGPALEKLSLTAGQALGGSLTVRDLEFSLSGLENQFLKYRDKPPADIAKFVIDSIARVLRKVTDTAEKRWPGLPIVGCGGVLANLAIREALPELIYASPSASSDNAAGVACIGWHRFKGLW
ncbi:MAG: DNA-binding protein [Oscillospiraceae bacterium]|jgi:N6-L-threonylcarbamoyladenine synthase|nr:DNA-binding protein [Oscillospiraceae bacterium]